MTTGKVIRWIGAVVFMLIGMIIILNEAGQSEITITTLSRQMVGIGFMIYALWIDPDGR